MCCIANLVVRVLQPPGAPGGGKMRDSANEVVALDVFGIVCVSKFESCGFE